MIKKATESVFCQKLTKSFVPSTLKTNSLSNYRVFFEKKHVLSTFVFEKREKKTLLKDGLWQVKKSYSATYIAFSLKGFFLKPNWAISKSDFDSAYISVLVKSLKKNYESIKTKTKNEIKEMKVFLFIHNKSGCCENFWKKYQILLS